MSDGKNKTMPQTNPAQPSAPRRCNSSPQSGYDLALAVLLENAPLYIRPSSDAFRHNLNTAMFQLVKAVARDMAALHARLDRLESLLKPPQRR